VDKTFIFGCFWLIVLPIAHGRVLDGSKDTPRRRFLFGAVWLTVLYIAAIVLQPGPELRLLQTVIGGVLYALVGGGAELIWYYLGHLGHWLKAL
jgi:hypothetical protein